MPHRPVPCAHCGSSQTGMQHPEHRAEGLPTKRWAQVRCRDCDARGPRILFERSDEWPHIEAEARALGHWNGLHGSRK